MCEGARSANRFTSFCVALCGNKRVLPIVNLCCVLPIVIINLMLWIANRFATNLAVQKRGE